MSVFKNKNQSTGILYLACSNLDLTATDINTIYQKRWTVEEFHKSIKSNLALAKSPTGIPHTQKNHVFACFFAFVKLERLRVQTNLNHFALKAKLYLNAIKTSFSLLQKMAIPSTQHQLYKFWNNAIYFGEDQLIRAIVRRTLD